MINTDIIGWLLIVVCLPLSYYMWYQNYIYETYTIRKIKMGTPNLVLLYSLSLFYFWQSSNDVLYKQLVFISIILTIFSIIIFIFPLLRHTNNRQSPISRKRMYVLIPFIPLTLTGLLISNLYTNKLWTISSAMYLSLMYGGYFYIYYYNKIDMYFSRRKGGVILSVFLILPFLFFNITLASDMLYWLYSVFIQINAVLLSIVAMFGTLIYSRDCKLDTKRALKGFSLLYGFNLILNAFALISVTNISTNKLIFDISISSLSSYQGDESIQIHLYIFIFSTSIFIFSLFYLVRLIFDLIENEEDNCIRKLQSIPLREKG